MTRLETVFNDAKTGSNAQQRILFFREMAHAADSIKAGEMQPAHFVTTCFDFIRVLPPQEQNVYLQPLIHGIDSFFREGRITVEKTMAFMEEIRGIGDITQMEWNAQNILRGWTMRREDRPPGPKL